MSPNFALILPPGCMRLFVRMKIATAIVNIVKPGRILRHKARLPITYGSPIRLSLQTLRYFRPSDEARPTVTYVNVTGNLR
jgi:hypothetical protein